MTAPYLVPAGPTQGRKLLHIFLPLLAGSLALLYRLEITVYSDVISALSTSPGLLGMWITLGVYVVLALFTVWAVVAGLVADRTARRFSVGLLAVPLVIQTGLVLLASALAPSVPFLGQLTVLTQPAALFSFIASLAMIGVLLLETVPRRDLTLPLATTVAAAGVGTIMGSLVPIDPIFTMIAAVIVAFFAIGLAVGVLMIKDTGIQNPDPAAKIRNPFGTIFRHDPLSLFIAVGLMWAWIAVGEALFFSLSLHFQPPFTSASFVIGAIVVVVATALLAVLIQRFLSPTITALGSVAALLVLGLLTIGMGDRLGQMILTLVVIVGGVIALPALLMRTAGLFPTGVRATAILTAVAASFWLGQFSQVLVFGLLSTRNLSPSNLYTVQHLVSPGLWIGAILLVVLLVTRDKKVSGLAAPQRQL